MKLLNYIFWKTTRHRLNKDAYESRYWGALFIFGLIFIILPLVITLKILNFDKIQQISKLGKGAQYVFMLPLVYLASMPFKLIFPKEKIRNLNYSNEEIKKNNRIIWIIVGVLILFCICKLYIVRHR